MRTALVTGALGFCGQHLLKKLHADHDLRVCGIDLAEDVPSDIFLDEYFCIDICNQDKLDHLIQTLKPEWIFHLAGINGDNPFNIYNINFVGSLYLLESVRKHAPESHVVLVGSSAEYGFASPDSFPLTEDYPCRPISAYGISKHAMILAGLNYVQNYGLKIVAARPFNIIGPGMPPTLVVGAIIKRIEDSLHNKNKLVIKMGNLDTERDFIDVDDAVNACIKLAYGGYWGEIFNICSGKPYSIRKIVEIIASFSNVPVEIEQDPALIRVPDIKVSFGSYAKAHNAFGFNPVTDLETTLAKIWQQHVRGEVQN
ncbi:MAG: NAD-dependent epimerase/dehydratase family protein [Anaerolineaceae bacterium]